MKTAVQPVLAAPYGFRVTIERNVGGGTVPHTFVCKTPHMTLATQQARYKTGFLRLISREPLTREQFMKEALRSL